MIGRGIGVAGIWLGVGLAIGLTGTGKMPGWVYIWVLVCATFVSALLVGPWTWDKN